MKKYIFFSVSTPIDIHHILKKFDNFIFVF
jgi:hypothetical protein